MLGIILVTSAAAIAQDSSQSLPLGSERFTDVPTGHWADEAIGWAVAQGITTGTSETTFSPNGTLTRAEMLTFLYRYHTQTVAAPTATAAPTTTRGPTTTAVPTSTAAPMGRDGHSARARWSSDSSLLFTLERIDSRHSSCVVHLLSDNRIIAIQTQTSRNHDGTMTFEFPISPPPNRRLPFDDFAAACS